MEDSVAIAEVSKLEKKHNLKIRILNNVPGVYGRLVEIRRGDKMWTRDDCETAQDILRFVKKVVKEVTTYTQVHYDEIGTIPKGEWGQVYGIKVLPNTATELAEAIYNQKDLPKEEAMEMAAYLDERYNMSGNVLRRKK